MNDETIDIAFICLRYETRDPFLKFQADKHGIDCLVDKNVNSLDFIEQIKTYCCDLLVSMSFNQIFKEEILNLAPQGFINCHAGKLPFYRGRNILNWALINDEKEFGITVHYIDTGIDTGDIILQKILPITDSDNYETLLERSYVACAEVLHESLNLIQQGKVKRINQDKINPHGSYFPQRVQGDERINWSQTSREVFNFVRAICIPGPQARSYVNGTELFINKVELIEDAPVYKCTAGTIVGKKDDKFIIKTLDSTIILSEYTCESKLCIGYRLS